MVSYRVFRAAAGVVFLAALTLFGLFSGACAWAADAASDQVEFRMSYLPSHNSVRHLVAAYPQDCTAWQVELTRVGETAVLASQKGVLPYPAAGMTLSVPKLGEGTYALTLTLSGPQQTLRVVRSFTRHIQPWENLGLGEESIVIPPFTPLLVNKKSGSVECVLRKHTMSDIGLWKQVASQQTPLLTTPMRIEVVAGGRKSLAKGKGLEFETTLPHQVTGGAAWAAGPVNGRTEVRYDYDGMMLVTLRCEPTSVPVESMTLVIPLKSKETWLMHTVTDRLRIHAAGRIPEGTGKVWDSANVARKELPGPFVPYIWVGGPERGICWFAENDKDWIVDPKTPVMEIVRDGGTVTLRIKFITKPGVITRQRSIVFGLQATPAKPLPETPYSFRRWSPVRTKASEGVFFDLMGACMYWGSQHQYTSFYPRNENYTIYDQLRQARLTGKVAPTFLDSWMAQYPKDYLGSWGEERKGMIRTHVNAGLTAMSFMPANTPGNPRINYVCPYTNPRGAGWDPSTETYMDEWSIFDIADPRWKDVPCFWHSGQRFDRELASQFNEYRAVWYEMEPNDAFIDMALYYHKKMLGSFADGIYWDNFFLQANYNPVSGPGYIDDEGRLRPGVNIMGMRKLSKRFAVMSYQMGKRPVEYIHMTNVNIVPMLSFGTINLDWEWRDYGDYAAKDMQERLEVDGGDTGLILAESTGFQTGNIGLAIDRFSGPDRKWLLRTALAVCLPHEMKLHAAETSWAVDILDKFGYGQADCRVYRYWEPGLPVKISGVIAKPLVLKRGQKALVVVGSYGPDGDCTMKLDLKALGLPGTVKAVNAETNALVQSSGPGTFLFPLKRHDVQFVLVQ